MAYFFDDVLPSTSETLSGFISGLGGAQETEDLALGDASHSASMNKPLDQPSRTSVEQIKHKAEELVETINLSRATDQELMAGYQDKLSDKLSEMFRQLGDLMVTVYEDNSKTLQDKLAELTEVLKNCHRLHEELLEANQALSHLRDTF